MQRRTFLALSAAVLAPAQTGWISLFNGRDLEGWRPSEHKDSWTVQDGTLAAAGPRSHLFYTGPVNNAVFRNFELEVEVLAKHLCNSGVYFHTAYQETGFPNQGFEIQVNNTAKGDGGYLEHKKTGSLYGVRNVYKQLIADDTWFTIRVAVRGKSVQVRLNDLLVVDYVEPTPAVIPESGEPGRFLQAGTFALQCHNDGSHAFFRSVRVRPLPDGNSAPVFEADALFRELINAGRKNYPMVDYEVRLSKDLTLEQALARARRDGMQYGIVSSAQNRLEAQLFLKSISGQPVFSGLDTLRSRLSKEDAAAFDYTIADGVISSKGQTAIVIGHGKPAAAEILEAKAHGARFVLGAGDASRCEYGLRMIHECRLAYQDFFVVE